MSGSSLEFFATEKDFYDKFNIFDLSDKYKYILEVSEVDKENIEITDPVELINYIPKYKGLKRDNVFIILEKNINVNFRSIIMEDGSGVKNIADQNNNFDAIEIFLGGDVKNNIIIRSEVRTTGETSYAKEKFKIFKKLFIKNSKKSYNNFYILPDAFSKLKEGWKLVHQLNSNAEVVGQVLTDTHNFHL